MAFAPMYQALLDNGCMSTAGSQSALNAIPGGRKLPEHHQALTKSASLRRRVF